MEEMAQIVSSLGFPIAMVLILMYYIKYTIDKFNDQIYIINDKHQNEISSIIEALNNNTIVLTKLTERLEGDNNE